MDPRLPELARRLAARAAELSSEPASARTATTQAAVAAILAGRDAALSVLLMRRAERPDDRWSGQISLPGGHASPADPDLAATARREALEEVGIPLEHAQLLGHLPSRRAKSRGRPVDTYITPFVFAVEGRPIPTLGPEATRAFWLPLERAASGGLDAMYRFGSGERGVVMPSWEFEGEVVWGMTYEMLRELVSNL